MSATLSRVADLWFVSIAVDTQESLKAVTENQGVVGVDLGVLSLATLSTGEVFQGAKAHKALLTRLRQLSKSLSSKLCSNCGYKIPELSLSLRAWQCPMCHVIHDRDVNAAKNLKHMAVSSTVTACGEMSAGLGCKTQVKLTSVKQEFNAKTA